MLFENGEPRDFIYLKVNRAFEDLTGLKNVEGRRVSELIPGILESDDRLLQIYGRVAQNGPPERFDLFLESLQQWFSVAAYCPNPRDLAFCHGTCL